jgi:arylsulfatase
MRYLGGIVMAAALLTPVVARAQSAPQIVHDAEYYILAAQHGEAWAVQDAELDERLAELRERFGTPPNIIHIMWDDQSFGDIGIPAIAKIRGFETPNINRMVDEGIMFTRMYTEPSCTPSRAAAMTGRHPIRNGMYAVAFPIEYGGLPGDEVTTAEVLSQAGYATAFYGKAHLGDIEQSYLNNQGFDEALWGLYNQIVGVWNRPAQAANALRDLFPDARPHDPYRMDDSWLPNGWVMNLEGQKGEQAREFGGTTNQDYDQLDIEGKRRMVEFIRRNAEQDRPFFVSYWPMFINFMPKPDKYSRMGGLVGDAWESDLDPFIGEVMDLLTELGIAENTLVIAMADNGPMSHNPPPGLGMTETIFRGGKGDFTEGGVRVPAFAWWPGTIEPGQLVGDIIHITDLFTTFARIGGATEFIPTDRIIDGLDQTALFVNGDTHGRRDYVFIYTGPLLGASVKGDIKRHWISGDPGDLSGVAAAYYDLMQDTREHNPLMTTVFQHQEAFNRMRARHELWMKRYPNRPMAHGPAYTGLSNARPETIAVSQPPYDMERLPFDPLEYIEHDFEWERENPDVGQR